jgi:signal transduction histidine kinase/ligand-binding sensor domain-containing protein
MPGDCLLMTAFLIRSRARHLPLLGLWLALLGLAHPVAADEPVPALGEAPGRYAISAWTAETGYTAGEILAMAQDLDGYLWLGTSTGLVRFDGTDFIPWGSRGEPALSAGLSVAALAGARDGGLWLGYTTPGGVVQIRDGKVIDYSQKPGAPAGGVTALLSDRRGTVWSGSRAGLHRFVNGEWVQVGPAAGFTGADVSSLYEDRSGALWVGSTSGVYRGIDGTFLLSDRNSTNVQSFAEDDAGHIWVTDTHTILRRLDRPGGPRHGAGVRLPASGWRLLRDRRGHLWVAALGGGLLQLPNPGDDRGEVERFAYEQRIAGAPRSLYEDRDGNIWVGVRGGGLLRLSETSFSSVPLEGLTNDGVRAAAAGADGSVWIATGYNLNHFTGTTRRVFDLAQTLALYSAPDGTLWASTAQGLGRIVGGRFVPVTASPAVRWGRVVSITSDREGRMWICSSQQGVLVWDRAQTGDFVVAPEFGARPCSTVYSDRHGRVWTGHLGGDVSLRDHDETRTFGRTDGLATGRVMSVLEDKAGAIWVSSANGISRYQDGRFEALTGRNGPIDNVVSTLVEDGEGYLWAGVQGGAAVLRFHPREMDKVATNPAHSMEYALYDGADGMQGALHWVSGATGVRGGDGRLWFATGLGLTTVDPHNLPRMRRASSPRIELITADARRVAPVKDLELPFDTSTLRFDYSAISLSGGSKLRYRYSLVGVDDTWVMAGTRRDVTYTNLRPGHHRFRVSATSDGLWTEAALWEFSIAAPFYQQRWFYGMIALGLAVSVGAAWGLRLRAMRRRYALVFAERARVSREIHDTLLQNLGAIGLELEAIALQITAANEPSRDALRRLRKQVGHSLREARESIWELRHVSLENQGLVDSLRALADKTTRAKGVPTSVTVTGRQGRSAPEVDMQLYRIAQEAVNNAVRHGNATEIQITLAYEDTRAVLSVSDNGCGFVVQEHDTAPATGDHLGLLSMRERAARIRGRFNIWSNPGHGTTIEAVGPLPAE